MKKKFAKIAVLICTMALALTCIFALVACGDGGTGTKYTYSETKVEMTMNGEAVDSSTTESTKTMYDTLYKGTTITVNDSKIVWAMSDQESTMNVKKDGNKYILSGDYVDSVKKGLNTVSGATFDFDMYGLKTDSGFNIVISSTSTMDMMGQTITSSSVISICFK